MATTDTKPQALGAPRERSQGISLRRALTLIAMTLLIPGSAQVAAGGRGIGRLALRVWLALLGLGW